MSLHRSINPPLGINGKHEVLFSISNTKNGQKIPLYSVHRPMSRFPTVSALDSSSKRTATYNSRPSNPCIMRLRKERDSPTIWHMAPPLPARNEGTLPFGSPSTSISLVCGENTPSPDAPCVGPSLLGLVASQLVFSPYPLTPFTSCHRSATQIT